MSNQFKIYIDRLRDGSSSEIAEVVDRDLMQTEEKELNFKDPIHITGQAYVANDFLIIDISIKTNAYLPCSICNKDAAFPVIVKWYKHTVEIKNIKSSIYDYSDLIRQTILLNIPTYIECNNKNCPERENITKYIIKS